MNRAKHQHPIYFSLTVSLLSLGTWGCASSDANDSEMNSSSEQATAKDASDESALETAIDVVCSDAPERMGKEAEMFTTMSWACTHKGEQVRIDLYSDAMQMDKAEDVLLEFYASVGDGRTLADLPMICGTYWSIGVDFNETRDELIASLTSSGVSASLCR